MSWILTLLTRLLRSVHAKQFLTLVACLLGLFVGRTWLSSHDAAVRFGATMADQKRVLAEADQRERQQDQSLAAVLSELHAEKQRVNTPAKAAAAIPKALPPFPEPITLTIPDRQDNHPPAAPSKPSQVPAQPYTAPSDAQGDSQPPAIASIPQIDLKPIYDFLEDCRGDQASLSATRADLSDEREQVHAMTAERDAAMRAAGKGSFWHRLSHNSKWFLLGAATAATLAATKNF